MIDVVGICCYSWQVTKVDPKVLKIAVEAGFIPVVATIATDEKGQALNINADTAAGEVRDTPIQPSGDSTLKGFLIQPSGDS